MWEHHKNGWAAISTNNGCCASVAAWLCKMLHGKYENVGIISASSLNGNGHVINYIKHRNRLFVIDAYAMTKAFVDSICIESGLKLDFRKTSIPSSVLMEVRSFSDYADFFALYFYQRSKEYMFFLHKEEMCAPISSAIADNITTIFYPSNMGIEPIEQRRYNRMMRVSFVKPPQNTPDWK
ncbi:MAG: hypothetical protein LBE13_03855 [Bacteroidales bacterium]|nr:hypothetical protein [Bacteroidales bacterium]